MVRAAKTHLIAQVSHLHGDDLCTDTSPCTSCFSLHPYHSHVCACHSGCPRLGCTYMVVGSRLTHIHLLSGGILPLLSLLEVALSRNASKLELPRDARTLRVVRVQLDEGQRIIGVRYPLPLIFEVELMLGTLSRAQSSEVSNFQCILLFLPILSPSLSTTLTTLGQGAWNRIALL